MSKVLVVTKDFPPKGGGISVKAYELVLHWANMGNNIIVLTNVEGESSDHYERVVVKLEGHYIWQAYKLSKAIKDVVKERNINKIFCMGWSPEGTGVLLSGKYKGRGWGIAANGFDIVDGLRTVRNRFLMRQVFKRADRLFPPSRYLEEKILTLGDFQRNIIMIPNSIDLEKFTDGISGEKIRKKYNIGDKKIIMTLCRLHPIKGVDVLIESFNKLCGEFQDIYLMIVGGGILRKELEDKVRELNLSEKVIFTGEIPHEKIPEYHAACDVFVQANRVYRGREEGHPIALVEAAGCGTPVVATKTGGVDDVVSDGETGYLVNPEDSEALAEKIKILLQDSALATKMGKAGRRIAEEKFDIKINAKKMLGELGE